jgi:hypothetical protein
MTQVFDGVRPVQAAPPSCPLVIGNVLVYRDANHITATYSKTLAPFLVARIKEAIG